MYFDKMCPDMAKRLAIYRKIGKGTFGRIYAAREIIPPPTDIGIGSGASTDSDSGSWLNSMGVLTGATDPRANSGIPRAPRQFAIKMELQCPLRVHGFARAHTCEYREVATASQRFLPVEAVILQLLTQCDRFPTIDSIYVHKEFASIVMSADSVDDNPLRETLPQLRNAIPTHSFPGYNGEQLTRLKRTRVSEIQACKIASHLLEAIVYLMDMKMVHGDLSHRNYLVDKNLNCRANDVVKAQLIDFGAVYAAERGGWMTNQYGYIEAFEYFVNPEIALAFATTDLKEPMKTVSDSMVSLDHDIRVQYLWKFGVLVYDLLHGYSPWETPERQPNLGDIKTLYAWQDDDEEKFHYLYDRRLRIMNEELPIDERLSQDCVDALRHLLARDESNRMEMEELQRLPWFQGHWVDHPSSELKRPPRVD
ncbi:hypothetical protein MferCBS31731_000784 [Microsporum ferrugineum]